jgi:DNA-binding response OmpR family regulator
MDGLTACKELRKTSNVPVIIVTARDDDVTSSAQWAPTTT